MTYLKSVWNLLSLRRVLLLTHHGQDAFTQLDDLFKAEIGQETKNDNQTQLLDKICLSKRTINLMNLFRLLNLFYYLIVFKLMSLNENQILNDESYAELNISDALNELIFENEYSKDHEEPVSLNEYTFKDLKLKNIHHLWKLLVSLYFDLKVI